MDKTEKISWKKIKISKYIILQEACIENFTSVAKYNAIYEKRNIRTGLHINDERETLHSQQQLKMRANLMSE